METEDPASSTSCDSRGISLAPALSRVRRSVYYDRQRGNLAFPYFRDRRRTFNDCGRGNLLQIIITITCCQTKPASRIHA